MQIIRKNLYKQCDVFKCIHDVHLHFNAEMSPYHILMEKNCFPHGCVYFQWKCKLLAKQTRCFRNFTKVGRKCFNCRYFYEEKIHQYPEFLRLQTTPDEFLENFEEFNEWVLQLKNKRTSCEGIVSEVRPDFILKKQYNNYLLVLRGYLISFQEGYIDNQFFQDKFYLRISTTTQNKLLFRKDDAVEFEARLMPDRGRFKFIKSGSFQFTRRGDVNSIFKYDVVTQKTFTIHPEQPVKCLNCQHGILVDIETRDPGPKRTVICLQGIQEFKDCPIHILLKIQEQNDRCANITRDDLKCEYLL